MDSLTEKDIQTWMDRTKQYLANYDPGARPTDSQLIPPELERLKITSIYVWKDTVQYLWMGGFDHTALEVKRLQDGNFQLTAIYDDEHRKVIWPTEDTQKPTGLLVSP